MDAFAKSLRSIVSTGRKRSSVALPTGGKQQKQRSKSMAATPTRKSTAGNSLTRSPPSKGIKAQRPGHDGSPIVRIMTKKGIRKLSTQEARAVLNLPATQSPGSPRSRAETSPVQRGRQPTRGKSIYKPTQEAVSYDATGVRRSQTVPPESPTGNLRRAIGKMRIAVRDGRTVKEIEDCIAAIESELVANPDVGAGQRIPDILNGATNGWPPLFESCYHSRTDVAELLLEYGADVNASSSYQGWTPIVAAVNNGDKKATELLMRWGANTSVQPQPGETLLDITRRNNWRDLSKLLQQASRDHKSDPLDSSFAENPYENWFASTMRETRLSESNGPTSRYGHRGVCYKGNVYIFGGLDDRDTAYLDGPWMLDTNSWVWSPLAVTLAEVEEGSPCARSGHGLVQIDGVVWLLWGFTSAGQCLDDVWRFDMTYHKWERVSTVGVPPEARGYFTATASPDGSKIWIYGGKKGDRTFKDMVVFDTSTHVWTTACVSGLSPLPRYGHSAARCGIMGDKIVIYGGIHLGKFCNKAISLNDVWVFDCNERAWQRVFSGDILGNAAPPDRYLHSCVELGPGAMMILGGSGTDGTHSDAWVLSYDTWRWHRIPACQEPSSSPGVTGHVSVLVSGDNPNEEVRDLVVVSHGGLLNDPISSGALCQLQEGSAVWLIEGFAPVVNQRPSSPQDSLLTNAMREFGRYIEDGDLASVEDILLNVSVGSITFPGGNTALHIAALHGRCEIVQYLKDRFTSTELTNDEGKTPLDLVVGRIDQLHGWFQEDGVLFNPQMFEHVYGNETVSSVLDRLQDTADALSKNDHIDDLSNVPRSPRGHSLESAGTVTSPYRLNSDDERFEKELERELGLDQGRAPSVTDYGAGYAYGATTSFGVETEIEPEPEITKPTSERNRGPARRPPTRQARSSTVSSTGSGHDLSRKERAVKARELGNMLSQQNRTKMNTKTAKSSADTSVGVGASVAPRSRSVERAHWPTEGGKIDGSAVETKNIPSRNEVRPGSAPSYSQIALKKKRDSDAERHAGGSSSRKATPTGAAVTERRTPSPFAESAVPDIAGVQGEVFFDAVTDLGEKGPSGRQTPASITSELFQDARSEMPGESDAGRLSTRETPGGYYSLDPSPAPIPDSVRLNMLVEDLQRMYGKNSQQIGGNRPNSRASSLQEKRSAVKEQAKAAGRSSPMVDRERRDRIETLKAEIQNHRSRSPSPIHSEHSGPHTLHGPKLHQVEPVVNDPDPMRLSHIASPIFEKESSIVSRNEEEPVPRWLGVTFDDDPSPKSKRKSKGQSRSVTRSPVKALADPDVTLPFMEQFCKSQSERIVEAEEEMRRVKEKAIEMRDQEELYDMWMGRAERKQEEIERLKEDRMAVEWAIQQQSPRKEHPESPRRSSPLREPSPSRSIQYNREDSSHRRSRSPSPVSRLRGERPGPAERLRSPIMRSTSPTPARGSPGLTSTLPRNPSPEHKPQSIIKDGSRSNSPQRAQSPRVSWEQRDRGTLPSTAKIGEREREIISTLAATAAFPTQSSSHPTETYATRREPLSPLQQQHDGQRPRIANPPRTPRLHPLDRQFLMQLSAKKPPRTEDQSGFGGSRGLSPNLTNSNINIENESSTLRTDGLSYQDYWAKSISRAEKEKKTWAEELNDLETKLARSERTMTVAEKYALKLRIALHKSALHGAPASGPDEI